MVAPDEKSTDTGPITETAPAETQLTETAPAETQLAETAPTQLTSIPPRHNLQKLLRPGHNPLQILISTA